MEFHFSNIFKKKTAPKKPLIVHICHHKGGTVWFERLMRDVAKEFNLKSQINGETKLRNNSQMWLFSAGDSDLIDFKKLNRRYTGTYMIRDLRDKIVSAYFYHKWCNEEWVKKKADKFGISFQDLLNSSNKEDGLILEMWALWNLLRYRNNCYYLENKNILRIKYEEVILNPEKWFPIIFQKWGFEEKDISQLMKIARRHYFVNETHRSLGEEKKEEHLRKGMPGDWKNHFTPKLKRIFKELFGNWLIKMGYEKDNQW